MRYWDGRAWTPHERPPVTAPLAGPLHAPSGTDWNTVWIWLVALLPAIPMVLLFFVPWGSMFAFDPYSADPAQISAQIIEAQFAVFLSPAFIASQLLAYPVYGLQVFFAYRDHRVLSERGVPRPFHWAWAFLNPVYPIGRSVVVKRRTGRGYAPLWAAIGVIALTLIATIAMTTMMIAGMIDAL